MTVVDSSGWVEYFVDGPNTDFFASAIEDADSLIVPTISIYEVYRHLLRLAGNIDREISVAAMRRGEVVALDDELACAAARLTIAEKLAMADAIILATARAYKAELLTQDADFAHVKGVRYKARKTTKK